MISVIKVKPRSFLVFHNAKLSAGKKLGTRYLRDEAASSALNVGLGEDAAADAVAAAAAAVLVF